jgi:hypothetical protein
MNGKHSTAVALLQFGWQALESRSTFCNATVPMRSIRREGAVRRLAMPAART